VRVVVENGRAEFHNALRIHIHAPLTGAALGVDTGITEVFTDSDGTQYGPELNGVIAKRAKTLLLKGRARNRLAARMKELAAQGRKAKAGRIRRFNLGRKAITNARHRFQETSKRVVNTAINQMLRKEPSVVVAEKLNIRAPARMGFFHNHLHWGLRSWEQREIPHSKERAK